MRWTGSSDRYALGRDKNNSAAWPSGQWVGDVRGAAKESLLDAAASRWTGGFPEDARGTGPLSLPPWHVHGCTSVQRPSALPKPMPWRAAGKTTGVTFGESLGSGRRRSRATKGVAPKAP
jgi:hypothetical protein